MITVQILIFCGIVMLDVGHTLFFVFRGLYDILQNELSIY